MLLKVLYLAASVVVAAAAQTGPPEDLDPSNQPDLPSPTGPASPTESAAGGANGTLSCGVAPPTDEFLAISRELADQEKREKRQDGATEPITIDTYVHFVLPSNWDSVEQIKLLLQGFNPLNSVLGENTPIRQKVRGQISRLNDNFASSNFRFTLKGSNVTFNDQWTQGIDEPVMKRSLRQGDYKTLNLFYIESVSGSVFLTPVLGWATLPKDVGSGGPTAYAEDGCIIRADELGNRATTHEVGHWLGLLHTFHNGCQNGGDLVDDTAPHYTSTDWCYPWAKTCGGGPNDRGRDERLPKNYMNYVTEGCSKEFTDGQSARMRSMWNRFRASGGS